jgi:ElaB/YqjD/DUF883 family membrane-anchored ribosome-binding protein
MKAHDRSHETATDKVVEDLKRVVSDSQELLHSTANVAGERAHMLRERLSDAMEAAQATCAKLQSKAAAGVQATDKLIRDNPYQSIGIAFGLGILIGVLATRSR